VNKADTSDNLKLAIATLKAKQKEDLDSIKDHFEEIYESLKPINLIKSTFNEVKESPDLLRGMVGSAIGTGVGFLMRKLFFKPSKNPIRNLAANAVQSIVSKFVNNHADKIVNVGQSILTKILSRKRYNAGTMYTTL
jgi:hypothetical protein